jgi:hypothetical protein
LFRCAALAENGNDVTRLITISDLVLADASRVCMTPTPRTIAGQDRKQLLHVDMLGGSVGLVDIDGDVSDGDDSTALGSAVVANAGGAAAVVLDLVATPAPSHRSGRVRVQHVDEEEDEHHSDHDGSDGSDDDEESNDDVWRLVGWLGLLFGLLCVCAILFALFYSPTTALEPPAPLPTTPSPPPPTKSASRSKSSGAKGSKVLLSAGLKINLHDSDKDDDDAGIPAPVRRPSSKSKK